MLHFMRSVPIYVYLPVVLGLLTLHGSTVYWAIRRIRSLQDALEMREILLEGDDALDWAQLSPGGTMVLTLEQPTRRIRITSKREARLRVVTE